MKVRYFTATDTLLIEFRDLDEHTTLDLGADGGLCAITIEHASLRAGAAAFSFEEIAA